MNHKIIFPTLALLTACGGEVEPSSFEPPSYNLPQEVLERTLARSSIDGISASETHSNGNHKYGVLVLQPGILVFSVISHTSTTAHYLLDLAQTAELEFPKRDNYDELYSLLLGEQKASLNNQIIDYKVLDHWLKIMDRK